MNEPRRGDTSIQVQPALSVSLVFVTAAIGILMMLGCGKPTYESQWTDTPIILDGHDSDWENAPIYFSEDAGNVAFGVVNDSRYLYLMIRSTDQRLARRIQLLGMSVWLDPKGKKKKDFGVRYSCSESLSQSFQQLGGSPGDMPPQLEETILSQPRQEPGTIIVVNDGFEKTIPENHLDGVTAGSGESNGIFTYEFRLPLPETAGEAGKGRRKRGERIGLGFELGSITLEMRQQMMQKMGGGRGGMGGGMGGGRGGMGGGMGGGRGGMGGGRSGRGGGIPEEKEIWVKITLAKGPDRSINEQQVN